MAEIDPDLYTVKCVEPNGEVNYHHLFPTKEKAQAWVDASVAGERALRLRPRKHSIVPVWLTPQPDHAVERYLAGLSEMLFARSEGDAVGEGYIADALDFVELDEDQNKRIDALSDSFRNLTKED